MDSNHLFIIGNGFDLWHDMPTNYKDFYQKYREYLDQIEHYFPNGLREEELWSDFENVLGKFDESILIDENDFMDFSGDDFPTQQMYGLEDAVDNFSSDVIQNITRSFTAWIKGINLESSKRQMTFPDTAHFINFNYTSTLQQLYKIPMENVYHIHGNVEQAKPLIFGHTEAVINATAEKDSYYTVAINNGRRVLEALQKPVTKIIRDRLNPLLESSKHISVITVIGHSLNKIDVPYFSRIVNQFPNALWQCYSYNLNEAIAHKAILEQIGIPKNNLSIGTYKQLVQKYPL
ncbi:bacteriophage abortive infection AbiH family protein [Pseudoalteromonas xiamenensis]|uniref:bacteriophage abortive infection AbiH family protein n=1 Tax=Pseudoalteromonas xiamenensis TaxID=882626 RepID=UPI0027E59716|nr:bacteriophage abortive infection AbiH family protein [Pseudoalteromonas xiamenensis]WMN59550.1 bacteriophage abortive infection AbiH family protein [Pseudoalteromonas xiamenensis]